jgi:hypothetical protein
LVAAISGLQCNLFLLKIMSYLSWVMLQCTGRII